METTAAVVREPGGPFRLENLQIDEPGDEEVLVELAGVGLCHTDLVFRDQFIPYPLPAVFGHEGAGTVLAVGRKVSRIAAGERVVLGFGHCGECARCDQGLPSYCRSFVPLNYAGARPDGSTALSAGGEAVASHFFGQSSFASLAICHERSAVRVDTSGLDLAILGPLACGFQTGAGSVLKSFDCPPGSSIAIFGGGPVGQAAVMAAGDRGCRPIALVEPLEARRMLGREVGATVTIDPAEGDPSDALRAHLPDGFDFVLETSGREDAMAAGLAALASRGLLGLVGVPKSAEVALSINVAGMITFGQRVIGIVEGDSDLHSFIPELLRMHRDGRFPFDRLVRRYPLADINQAIDDQARGDCVKAVLVP